MQANKIVPFPGPRTATSPKTERRQRPILARNIRPEANQLKSLSSSTIQPLQLPTKPDCIFLILHLKQHQDSPILNNLFPAQKFPAQMSSASDFPANATQVSASNIPAKKTKKQKPPARKTSRILTSNHFPARTSTGPQKEGRCPICERQAKDLIHHMRVSHVGGVEMSLESARVFGTPSVRNVGLSSDLRVLRDTRTFIAKDVQ